MSGTHVLRYAVEIEANGDELDELNADADVPIDQLRAQIEAQRKAFEAEQGDDDDEDEEGDDEEDDDEEEGIHS